MNSSKDVLFLLAHHPHLQIGENEYINIKYVYLFCQITMYCRIYT